MPDTLTVPLGEMHEDFKTLKEEVQRETQEVEKLSPVGRSSLLTSLSHLLGKKKELQDLEQTVRVQSTGSMEGGKCGWWQPLQMGRGTANGTVTKGCGINSRCPSQGCPSSFRLLDYHCPLLSLKEEHQYRVPGSGARPLMARGYHKPMAPPAG